MQTETKMTSKCSKSLAIWHLCGMVLSSSPSVPQNYCSASSPSQRNLQQPSTTSIRTTMLTASMPGKTLPFPPLSM